MARGYPQVLPVPLACRVQPSLHSYETQGRWLLMISSLQGEGKWLAAGLGWKQWDVHDFVAGRKCELFPDIHGFL